jgi:Putative motility protein
MDAMSLSAVNNASNADLSTVQGAAAVSVMKKAMNLQAASTLQLIQSLPQPALASSGSLGTQVNTFA